MLVCLCHLQHRPRRQRPHVPHCPVVLLHVKRLRSVESQTDPVVHGAVHALRRLKALLFKALMGQKPYVIMQKWPNYIQTLLQKSSVVAATMFAGKNPHLQNHKRREGVGGSCPYLLALHGGPVDGARLESEPVGGAGRPILDAHHVALEDRLKGAAGLTRKRIMYTRHKNAAR